MSSDQNIGSWPIPLSLRNWGGFLAGAVSLTAGVATWSFVVGGFTAYYVDAKAGTATMLAGGLIAQFLISLAQVPVVTKYGLETVTTSKAQLGTRGSAFALFVQYLTLIGWNCVLIIFLGRAFASTVVALELIRPDQVTAVATAASVGATILIWLILLVGVQGLKYFGVVNALTILLTGSWMYYMLFQNFGLDALVAAQPISPLPQGKLMNYSVALEILLVSTLSWWAYMGSIFRMVAKPSTAIYPSMFSLGLGWAAIGLIGLYAGLVVHEPDPTVWIMKIAGPVGGLIVLVFVIVSNLGSTLVGAHAAALGVGQLRVVDRNMSWAAKTFSVLVPMLVVEIFFAAAFYDNIGTFMAFIGIFIAPLVGVQIVDWFIFDRINRLHVPSLFRQDSRSCYYYTGGFNPVGLAALVLGAATYVALIDPITFVPNSDIVQYTTATLPAVLVGALVYYVGTLLSGAVRVEDRLQEQAS